MGPTKKRKKPKIENVIVLKLHLYYFESNLDLASVCLSPKLREKWPNLVQVNLS